MRIKTALIIFFAFSFIGTQAITSRLAMADDQSSIKTVETRHHWILWKIEQDPETPRCLCHGCFQVEEIMHIPSPPTYLIHLWSRS